MIKKYVFILITLLCSIFYGFGQSDVIISQYIETNSGTTPKGIEIFNVSGSDIVFSSSNNLQVFKGTNGGSCVGIGVNITSGTLSTDEVWVIGTSDLTSYATTNGSDLSGVTIKGFTFNGDDALQIRLAGVIQDEFGTCGSDPGSSWSGSGVSTANNNLQIKDAVCDGDIDGWTDPSIRFDEIANGVTMTGFGNAPASCTSSSPTISVTTTSVIGLDYIFTSGPSSTQSFDVTGANLITDLLLNGLTNFEIATIIGGPFSSNITIPHASANGTNTIYVRLKSGLAINTYNETITASSIGATNKTVALDGQVTPVVANVVITEIMYNTSGTDDEWIEICNISGSSQDISSYIIDVDGTTEFNFPASTTIADGNCIVISLGSNGDGIYNPDCPFIPDYGIDANTNITNNLGNSSDTITLYTLGGSTVVDTVTYDDGDEASTDGNGSSYHVTDAAQDNFTTATNWEAVIGGSPGSNSTTSACQFPEINVEGNLGTFPDIVGDGSNVPAGFNNTLFTSTEIGSSSIKTFRIQNLGGADLNISYITITGTHASDFSVSNSPSTTISSASNTILEITFSPTAIDTRNAIVTINSDDSNEGTYTFNIQGNGICSTAVISVSSFDPVSGPVGTEVTINGNGFTGSSTITINGENIIESTFISSSQIVVVVPEVNYDGSFVITEGSCKTESSTFSIINNSGSCGITDLIMTEIYDKNGGSLAYVEIYNGTGSTIDLTNYYIRRYGDATDFSNNIYTDYFFTPSLNTIADNEVLYGKMSSDTDVASPDFNYTTGAFAGINADDILHLYNGTTLIDVYEIPVGTGIGYTALRDLTTAGGNISSNPGDWTHNTTESTSNLGAFPYSISYNRPLISNPIDITGCNVTGSLSITATQGNGGVLSYQWFYYNTTVNSWETVTNATFPLTTITGETSNTLDLGNFYYNYSGYQFYCLVTEAGVCSVASNAAQIKTETTIWDGTTWDNGSPTSSINAILNGSYNNSSNGNLDACNLTISSGNTLTIEDNSYTQVQYNILVEGTVTVHPSGSLVQTQDNGLYSHINLGTSSITKLTAQMNNWYEYTYWSSPVIGETVESVFPDTNANRRFWYNAANYLDSTREVGNNNQSLPGQDDIDDNGDDWQIASGVMQSGWGYAATYSTSAPYPNVFGSAQFIGPFNTDTIDVTVYKNDSESNDNNWNLIGNPYPCAISADTFLTVNAVVLDENVPISPPISGVSEGAIFLWSQDSSPSNSNNGNENQNFAQSDYAIINLVTELAGGDGVTPNRFIPSGQSFFISYHHSAPGTGGTIKSNTITFNNSMRVTNNNNQFFRQSNENTNKLWINLESDNGVFNQLAVAYIEEASDNYDGMKYDTPRNLGTGVYATIYTLIDNIDKRFAIQGKNSESLSVEEIIPVGFSTSIEVPTIYTISLANFEGEFLSNNTLYLKDNMMNVIHNLSASNYTFNSEIGEFNERFEIIFNNTLSTTETEFNSNHLTIIELENGNVQFSVNDNNRIKSIKIIDVLGRVLYHMNGNNNTEIYNLSNLSQSTYIAKVELSNGFIITKKAIKRK